MNTTNSAAKSSYGIKGEESERATRVLDLGTASSFLVGQGLTEHTAAFDALVPIIEGNAEITISEKPYRVQAGEATLLPANQPHALAALTPFKMLLTMIRA
ncbi:MAG: cupin domain-containing protein [Candidatus Acidiferrum sp.]|jgi:quercetin dioxygenase-like cupin family protein